MVLPEPMYVIRRPVRNGFEYLYGFQVSRRTYKADVGWISDLEEAYKMTLRSALSVVSLLIDLRMDISVDSIVAFKDCADKGIPLACAGE